jgi:thioredoxin-dependent peroxiredoxin
VLGGFFSDPLPAGTPAPDISAADETGAPVKLSALRGRPVVLLFYPGDDTPTCTQQLCELRDNWAALQKSDAAVFGVNPRGAESHRRFGSKFSFPFPLIVDAGGRVASDYRCGGLVVRRTVYVIGRDGRIAWSVRGRPAVEEILAAVKNS